MIYILQVTRMLPGGLHVIGIFAAGPPDQMKNAQVKLRQVCIHGSFDFFLYKMQILVVKKIKIQIKIQTIHN